MDADPAEVVRFGYNAISLDYRGDDDPACEYEPWMGGLQERVPHRWRVLDIGCGVPVGFPRRDRMRPGRRRRVAVTAELLEVVRARVKAHADAIRGLDAAGDEVSERLLCQDVAADLELVHAELTSFPR